MTDSLKDAWLRLACRCPPPPAVHPIRPKFSRGACLIPRETGAWRDAHRAVEAMESFPGLIAPFRVIFVFFLSLEWGGAGRALQVIGIECSTIIEQARKIVAANGYADKITLIKSKCEDIASLEDLAGVDKVRVWVCVLCWSLLLLLLLLLLLPPRLMFFIVVIPVFTCLRFIGARFGGAAVVLR